MSANPWFDALPLGDQQALLASGELLRLRPGEMLFRQGDAPGGFYGLLDGLLKISSLREDGREAILVVLEAGNWIGEISLMDGEPRTHDATALSAVEVLVVPQAAFAVLMQGAPFARAIAGLLAARVRSLYGMVEDAALRSTRARVARRLLLLARGDATMALKARPMVRVSQEALAMMLGISRQTLSVELKVMVQRGAIVLGYRCIEIVSPGRLEALGNVSP
ncbi:MAG: Crp/Fnr family transcriptional regulator [Polaromonas sp.]|uniref:Crp/Fnr family transcriptional regulator n=1 Tax=Polaromonas sp. TaxID=1869339 RepID=UPI0032670964